MKWEWKSLHATKKKILIVSLLTRLIILNKEIYFLKSVFFHWFSLFIINNFPLQYFFRSFVPSLDIPVPTAAVFSMDWRGVHHGCYDKGTTWLSVDHNSRLSVLDFTAKFRDLIIFCCFSTEGGRGLVTLSCGCHEADPKLLLSCCLRLPQDIVTDHQRPSGSWGWHGLWLMSHKK